MRYLEDLRFIIGLLFGILGVLVLGAGLLHPVATGGVNANLIGGGVMTAFAALMLALAIFGGKRGE